MVGENKQLAPTMYQVRGEARGCYMSNRIIKLGVIQDSEY